MIVCQIESKEGVENLPHQRMVHRRPVGGFLRGSILLVEGGFAALFAQRDHPALAGPLLQPFLKQGEQLAVRRVPAVDLDRTCGDADGANLGPEPRAQDRLSPLLCQRRDLAQGCRLYLRGGRDYRHWLRRRFGR